MHILEPVINRYLALDPEVRDKLAVFRGKVIKLDITGINRSYYLFPGEDGIQVKTRYDGEADTVLSGSPASIVKMGLVADVSALLLTGEVEIKGDTRLGHEFKNVFRHMDIDWFEPLADIAGDGVASLLEQTGHSLLQWGKHTVSSVSNSASEYLQEESRDVVTETELEIFNEDVDKLRNDVDRLEAKVNSLTRRKGKN